MDSPCIAIEIVRQPKPRSPSDLFCTADEIEPGLLLHMDSHTSPGPDNIHFNRAYINTSNYISIPLLQYRPAPLLTNYPVRVCAAGLCVWSRRFVYI